MIMLKMNIRQLLGVVVFLTLFSGSAMAQNLSVSYKNKPLEEVLADLKQKTNYNFVYQKQILAGIRPVTANFNDMPLPSILDRVLYNNGLDYEIVKENVIIRQADKENFKKVVSGRVTDSQNVPLPGVNVRVKDTGAGVATGIDGDYSIPVEGSHPVLVFSFVGMHDKEIRITRETQNPVMVEMQENAAIMEEVIVTGYQNIKRENATGAYQLITSKDMDKRYTTDIVSNLEGKIPGLVSYSNGNNGKGEEALTIRGVGSFQAKTQPLIVVDGLPIEGSLETVNRYDIESVTVLKDASAASIYGARASNGVIVITTKRAYSEKLSVDVSADVTVSELPTYGHYRWANASQLIDLEEYNFNYVVNDPEGYNQLLGEYNGSKGKLSPIMMSMMDRHTGKTDAAAYDAWIARWRKNDYRKEWQDVMLRNQLVQQYNVALRSMGKYLNSNIVLNYKGDNTGMTAQKDNALNLAYKGEANLKDFIHLSVGVNLIRENSKTHADYFGYKGMNAFAPYLSMYGEDGRPAAMQAGVWLGESSLADPDSGLKSEAYNLLDEVHRNFRKAHRTNIRSFIHADVDVLPDLNVGARFQYEDIAYKSEKYLEKDSYDMRHLYNLFTSGGEHYIPDGGMLNIDTENGGYYTFRTQANYTPVFGGKHALEVNAGFEYRESKVRSTSSLILGYDDQTQINTNHMIDFEKLHTLSFTDLGKDYSPLGSNPAEKADNGNAYYTSETLHRFYSYYFTGNYIYDKRYSASFSFRVDKTDLFGADPEFRGRPLWSVGLSWNLNNETFLRNVAWVDVLKLRASYGLTGNIDSSVSSFLTASLTNNEVTGDKKAELNTPPNDQLRWEKTASWNAGADFSFFGNRLSGSLDGYRKYSSDLLALTDLDPTGGWSSLTINNGEMLNTGVELMLNGDILAAGNRKALGIRAALSFSYNKNEVKKVEHEEPSGFRALKTLHEGHPVNSLYSWRFAGYSTDENGYQQVGWTKADGSIQTSDVGENSFRPEDIVFSGSLDPKYTGSFTPEITWNGFSLSAMFSYYGGHKMRARVEDWGGGEYSGSYTGYGSEAVPASFLNYWNATDKNAWRANGYAAIGTSNANYLALMDANVVPADYLKVRNIVLAYAFPKALCQRIGMEGMRLRFQVNNVATWVRNKAGIDPEANIPSEGITIDKTPRSYTVSLNINF